MSRFGGAVVRWVRTVLRGPGILRLALVCLALGIGMNAAAFSVVEAVLLSPLPFAGGERLVTLATSDEERGIVGDALTWAELGAARDAAAIDRAEGFYERNVTVRGPERAERLSGAVVTPGLFPLLGLTPRAGRLFGPGEGAEAGFEQVVIIGEGLWRRQFGGDPGIIGRSLVLNDRPVEIIGVMPAAVRFPDDQELWLPLGADDETDAERRFISVVARLGPDVTLSQARSELLPLAARVRPPGPEVRAPRVIGVEPLRHAFVPEAARRFLPLMMAGVAGLLLVACANVANLLLTRSLDRDREMAVRAALGASRSRLAGQVLSETAGLAGTGAVLGLAVAWLWLQSIGARLPQDLPYWVEPRLTFRAGAFVVLITALATILSSLLPLLRLIRGDQGARLRARGGSERSMLAVRGGLVAGEIALTLVLLVGAGLLVSSFVAITTADLGFEDERIISFRTVLAGDAYDAPGQRLGFYERMTGRIAELPEVTAAVATTAIPPAGAGPLRAVSIPGAGDAAVAASVIGSSAGFFEALRIPVVAGRAWSAGEAGDTGAAVAVVGERLARRLWPGESALDREIEVERLGRLRVIGVAADVSYHGPGEPSSVTGLQLHVPIARLPSRAMAVLATTRPGAEPAARIRQAVASVDPTQAIYDLKTLPALRAEISGPQRLFASLFTEFGLLSLILAMAGVYGTLAYDVRRRQKEIAIRSALGATRGRLLRMVISRGAAMAAVGIAIGLAAVAATVRSLQGLLVGVAPYDPRVLSAVTAVLAIAAFSAAVFPALRATRIRPGEALREG